MLSSSLRNKLLGLALIPISLILTVLLSLFYVNESASLAKDIENFRSELISERQNQLKESVQIAQGVVEYQLALGDKGNVNAALRDLRFGSAGYFFIWDDTGTNILLPIKPELEGQNKIDLTDPNGTKIVVGLLDAAKSGRGSFSYYYQKPGSSKLIEKLSYSVMIPNTNWMLGSGAYIDDIDESIAAYETHKTEEMNQKAFLSLLIALGLTGVTAFVVVVIAHKMVVPIQNMATSLNDIAKGEGDLTKRLEVASSDEIGQLGSAFNLFVDKLQHIIGDVAGATDKVKQAAQSISGQTSSMTEQLYNHNNEIDQIVTAITEMSATANDVAHNTSLVADATHAASDNVSKAQDCVDTSLTEVSNLMSQIDNAAADVKSLSEQSQKINTVLSVIGGIAEQ
ncbi:cache domain-containing protein, partial [Shewanella sp. A14]